MKDFDAERNARSEWPEETFQVAGKQFRLKPQMPARALSAYADLELHTAEHKQIAPHTYETMSNVIRESLHQDDQHAWDDLLDLDLPNPLTLADLLDIGNHIVTTSTGRPTTPLSASGGTEESGGTKLTVASASTEEPARPASISAAG